MCTLHCEAEPPPAERLGVMGMSWSCWGIKPYVRCFSTFLLYLFLVALLWALGTPDPSRELRRISYNLIDHVPEGTRDGQLGITTGHTFYRSARGHICSRRHQRFTFSFVIFAAAADTGSSPGTGDELTSSEGVPESSLSSLQSYLYSVEAARDALLIGGAIPTFPSDTAPSPYLAAAMERNVSTAAKGATENVQSLPSAPSSVPASLAASLNGRYVVFSRLPQQVESDDSPGISSGDDELSPQRGKHFEWQYGCLGAPCRTVDTLGGGTNTARGSSLRRTATRPVFPEVALRRVAAATAVFRERIPHATGAPSTPLRKIRDDRNTTKNREAEGETQLSGPRNVFAQTSSRSARRTVAAPLQTVPELEVHIVDARHILVYLPPHVDGFSPSASLLQALAASGREDGAVWRMWDIFAPRGGAKLKFSDKLRGLLEAANVTAGAHAGGGTVHKETDDLLPLLPLEVALWTARGMAGEVHSALVTSPRLRRFFQKGRAGTRPPACRARLSRVDEEVGTVTVEIKAGVQPPTLSGVGDISAHVSLWQSNSSRSLGHLHSEVLVRSCVREFLLCVAAHPAVRWVEETLRYAETLNLRASSIIQYGHCSSYALDANSDTAPGGKYSAGAAEMSHPFWDLGWNGTGEVIGLSDSGVDVQSCFFRDDVEPVAIYPKVNVRHRKILSYHPYEADGKPPDTKDRKSGHGTHVAGTAAGYCVGGLNKTTVGMAKYNGVATGAQLFVRDLSPGDREDLLLPANVLDLFTVARGVGARVSSNSWGLPTDATSYLAVEKMIDTFVAEQRDMLIIMSSGNEPKSGLYMPGRAKNVLTVGAHPNSLTGSLQDTVSPFSSTGPTYDNRRKPELVAPGGGSNTWITSARSADQPGCSVYDSKGTSMATGAVAGAAAIMRQYLREYWSIENPSAALLRAALVHSTKSFVASSDNRSEYGRLDLSLFLPHGGHTLDTDLAPIEHWILDDAVVKDGDVVQYCFALSGPSGKPNSVNISDSSRSCRLAQASTLMATLVWSDPGLAAEGSKRSQVHDLDLMLLTQFGNTYYSGAGGKRDTSDTVEQVRVLLQGGSGGSAAEWTAGFRVLVRGASIRNPEGQSFAMTVSAPGLTAVKCADLFADWRRGKTAPQRTAAGAFCPMNCSHHGSCDPNSLLCSCEPSYTSVDCTECNADVVCQGYGTCTAPSMQCTCDPRGHFADASCSVCADGWYGPLCDSDCVCQNGGVCDKHTGQCRCVQSSNLGEGCFSGDKCQYCCEGRAGDACDQGSYWCNTTGAPVLVGDTDSGYIQVNGYGAYPYSTTCRWQLQAPPGQKVHLRFISYDIERYDSLKVYDVLVDSTNQSHYNRTSLGTFSGFMRTAQFVLTSSGSRMDVEFVSDWYGAAPGFLLFYRFTRCGSPCNHQNLTSQPERWQCSSNFGLQEEQCLCNPPYVGWHCSSNASDVGVLAQQLNRLPISTQNTAKKGDLAWMMPRSPITAVEAVFSVLLESGYSSEWQQWLDNTDLTATLTVPVRGIARMPLVVHGLTELYIPQLTLPTSALFEAGQSPSANETQIVEAELRLVVKLQTDGAWMNKHAKRLGLSLGISLASEKVSRVHTEAVQSAVVEPVLSILARHGIGGANLPRETLQISSAISATTNCSSTPVKPLSFEAFNFTPIVLQDLHDCAYSQEINVRVPLRWLPPGALSSIRTETNTTTAAAAARSRWTARVVFFLFWNATAGTEVANESVLDAVVVAQDLRLTRVLQSRSASIASIASVTATGTTSERHGKLECDRVTCVRTLIGQRLLQHVPRARSSARHLSWRFVLVVLSVAACFGVAGGVFHAFMQWGSRRRSSREAYVVILNTEEGHEMHSLDQPHI